MAIYRYGCERCGKTFDVHKPMKKMDTDERCECGGTAHRNFVAGPTPFTIGIPKSQTADFPYTGKRFQ